MSEPSEPDPPADDLFFAALTDAARPETRAIGGYEILDEISRGGMGVVYHARQLRPEREVALKVLLPQFAEDPEMLARFHVEARAMAALDHPGILPVYEVGEADGAPFFSMKLATGGSLAERLDQGPLEPRAAAALMIELTRAVHHAHQHGVLHRDLKPGNFLFTEDGRACVSDFGLAKLTRSDQLQLTRTESFFGTPHYMPPEVASGSVANATVAGDLYSMGAVFYECLTGRRPHRNRDSMAALLRAIADESITPPDEVADGIPRDLAIICMKALERNPTDRYPTLGEFADDLERWMEGRPIHARAVGPLETLWRLALRHPLPAALVAALVLVSVVGTVLVAVSNHQRGLALDEARQKLQRSLIDQASKEGQRGEPGHRHRVIDELQQAAAIGKLPEIRDVAAAVLARPDLGLEPATRNEPAAFPPTDALPGDPVLSRMKAGESVLTVHLSGRGRLWAEGRAEPVREWVPMAGRELVGAFVSGGLLLAETPRGLVRESLGETPSSEVLAPPGAMVRFLAVGPSGDKVALAGADGVRVMDLGNGSSWHWGDAPARCEAAWSGDGRRLAVAVGDRREVVVLAADTGASCATIPVTGIPQHLALDAGGGTLAVASDDGLLALCEVGSGATWGTVRHESGRLAFSDNGRELVAGSTGGEMLAWPVFWPVAFREWSERPRAKADGAVIGMSFSPNRSRLLTVTNGCVAVWSVIDERQTDVCLLENQRIDAGASAWWLGDDAILVQVPGGLERRELDEEGRFGGPQRVPRLPGSRVLDVRADGDWLVSVMDEYGDRHCEWWKQGDPEQSRRAAEPEAASDEIRAEGNGVSAKLGGDGTIEVLRTGRPPLHLTPPLEPGVRALGLSPDGKRLTLLTRRHRVFTWDLGELAGTLDDLGL